MGSPIEISVPEFDSTQAVPGWARRAGLVAKGPLGSARMRAENLTVSRRFLVRGVYRNDPKILPAMLGKLSGQQAYVGSTSEGFRSQESVEAPQLAPALSIDGLIYTRIVGAIALTAVVRVCEEDVSPGITDTVYDESSSLLHDVASALKQIPGHLESHVSAFSFIPEDLFVYRNFTEYRFGASAFRSDWRSRLAEACRRISKSLGDLDSPIAYLYFPSNGDLSSTDFPEDPMRWAVVGVGLSSHPIDAMRNDSAAESVASGLGLSLQQFDPSIVGMMADRLSETVPRDRSVQVDSRDLDDAHPPGTPLGQSGVPIDIVFAHGPAQTGLVARMLACAGADTLGAGSMTVLGGHTVAGWAVARGEGSDFVRELTGIDSRGGAGETEHLRALAVEVPPSRVAPHLDAAEDTVGFWMEWECPDRGGALNAVVDELSIRASEAWGVSPEFSYIISRVIQAESLCSGKGKFHLPGVPPAEFAASLEAIREQLLARLSSHVGDRDPVSVNLSDREGSERPWAVVSYSMDHR
jgi:hypothetical protein